MGVIRSLGLHYELYALFHTSLSPLLGLTHSVWTRECCRVHLVYWPSVVRGDWIRVVFVLLYLVCVFSCRPTALFVSISQWLTVETAPPPNNWHCVGWDVKLHSNFKPVKAHTVPHTQMLSSGSTLTGGGRTGQWMPFIYNTSYFTETIHLTWKLDMIEASTH